MVSSTLLMLVIPAIYAVVKGLALGGPRLAPPSSPCEADAAFRSPNL
jgi:hypothetical protein